jgi:uncharacterized delta-60 repeat protein
MKKILPVLSIFILCAVICNAQDGTLDNSFGVNGIARIVMPGMQDIFNTMALQPDGKIVTCGTFNNGANKDFVVARFNANGTTDNSFGTGGKVTTGITAGDDLAFSVMIQPDGKIVVAGNGNNGSNNDVVIVRYNADGSLDNTFDGDGKVVTDLGADEGIRCMTIQADGKIIVAGGSSLPGQYDPTIWRYNTNGSLDNTFNSTGFIIFAGTANSEFVLGITLQPDGKIVASGYENLGINAHGELIRLNTNGTPDNSFGVNGFVNSAPQHYTIFYNLTVLASGKIAIVGAATNTSGSTGIIVGRFNANGTADNSFSNGSGFNSAHPGNTAGLLGIKEQTNGKLITSGSVQFNPPEDYDYLLVRFNTNGSFDSTFDADGILTISIGTGADAGYADIIQPNGQVLVSGNVQNGSDYDFGLIRVNTDVDAALNYSGKAINFDGVDDYVALGNLDFASADYTIEGWFNLSGPLGSTYEIVSAEQTNGITGISIDIGTDNKLRFLHRNPPGNSGGVSLFSSQDVTTNKWYHIACVKTGTTLQMYINGVLENTVTDASVTNLAIAPITNIGYLNSFAPRNFNGVMDEFSFYNTALTQTEIRDWMCKKVTTFHPKYNNLVAYYRFDEGIGNTSFNLKGSGTNGTLMNSPLWVTSGAAIGNASAYNYAVTPTATLAHPQGESLQVTTTAGAPTGVQLYRVDSVPNITNGAPGIGANNRYFGVFVIGGTTPQYTAVYNYNGNPFVNAGNENNLALYKRNNNADLTWVNAAAALNTTTKTLTATGQFTEYILGNSGSPLPVQWLSFTVTKQNTTALLLWQTASEQNNKGFEIERSSDGINFTAIGWVNGVGNSSIIQNYSFIYATPLKGKNFYRLKQIDFDAKITLSDIRRINFDAAVNFTVYPNPVKNEAVLQLSDNVATIRLTDISGKEIWRREKANTGTVIIPMQYLSSGFYLIQVTSSNGEMAIQKIIKQ